MKWFPTWRTDRIPSTVAEHLARLGTRIERLETAPRPADDPDAIASAVERLDQLADNFAHRIMSLESSVENMEEGHKELVIAVSEGIERVDRAERRIKATVKRARKELSDRGLVDPGLEAEDQELHDVDGEGSDGRGVPPVREEVAPAADAPSSIKGVPLAVLRRARGF